MNKEQLLDHQAKIGVMLDFATTMRSSLVNVLVEYGYDPNESVISQAIFTAMHNLTITITDFANVQRKIQDRLNELEKEKCTNT